MTECLSRLLAPLSREVFLKHYRAREHFYIARDSPDYYSYLPGVADLDAVLQSQHLPISSINVVMDGVRCPLEEWSRLQTGARGVQLMADPEKLLARYAGGATLILNQLHRVLPTLNSFCQSLTGELGFPTQTNVYITPRASAGFARHADDHDVLILQIAGDKEWVVYGTAGGPAEIDLKPGDLLYIPRGMFHAARSHDEDSIHITLGLLPVYAFQMIHDIEAVARAEPRLQRPMPPRFAGTEAMMAFEAEFLNDLQRLIGRVKPGSLVEHRRDDLVADQAQGWAGRLSDLRELHRITRNTLVCRRPGILTTVRDDGRSVSIEFAGRQVAIPFFMRHELPRILGDSQFRVDAIEGMVTRAGKIKFVTEFVKAGLLQIVSI